MPRTRLAHLGPTPRNERKIAASHGSTPPWSFTTRHATACICGALASWKVPAWIASSMASGVSWLMVSGVRAKANSRCAQDKVTASRVRIEMIQATSSSNGEPNPSSASANSAACGKGRIASRTRAMATSIAKGRLSVIGKPSPPCFGRKGQRTDSLPLTYLLWPLAYRTTAKKIHDGQQNDRSKQRYKEPRQAKVALVNGANAKQRRQQEPGQQSANHPNYNVEEYTLLLVCTHDETGDPSEDAANNEPQNEIHTLHPFRCVQRAFSLT